LSEVLRKTAHAGVGFFALLYGVLPPAACLGLALLALAHNVFLLPRYARVLWREPDHRRGYSPGVIAYSVTLVLLSAVYWNRPDVGAAGWGVLAFGDGMASLAGGFLRGPKLPWNDEKSWSGFIAFFLFASAASFLLSSFVRSRVAALPPSSTEQILLASLVAAMVGAVVESLPLPFDDNLTAPLAASAAFLLLS
jgi:dolichol kinase